MIRNNRFFVISVFPLIILPVQVLAFNDNRVEGSPCTIINNGTIQGGANLNCLSLPEQNRQMKQMNDHIDLLSDEIARLKQERQSSPENPWLAAEQQAVQSGDLELAAELREQYYQGLKQDKQSKFIEMGAEMAGEAFIAASRWEDASNMKKALSLYQEAIEFKKGYLEAWKKIPEVARKMDDFSLALAVIQNLQQLMDAEKDRPWLAVALSIEGGILKELGQNLAALRKYQVSQSIRYGLANEEPDNLDRQYDLFVSYKELADIQQGMEEYTAALETYENSLSIVNRLVERDFKRRGWQHDLLMSYDRKGRMNLQMNNHFAALMVYEEGLMLVEQLAERDSDWRPALAVSYDRMGDMSLKVDDSITAAAMYKKAFTVCKSLVELEPDNVGWNIDLMISYRKLAQVAQPKQAKTLLSEALATMQKLNRKNKLNHRTQSWIAVLKEEIERLP